MKTWEVRRDGVTLAWGPEETFPSPKERKVFRSHGYKIFVDGKLYKEN